MNLHLITKMSFGGTDGDHTYEPEEWMKRKLVATLARCHECGPSESWLGPWAYSEKVQRSGMWTSEYVDDAYKMTISDLEEMERHVKKMSASSAT